eukprot:TRINITY_DN7719_c0_g2_i1.p1 TRINITY_DN7719_c0_g2~~TRINITY_DN7719_c0_g2_i1.p1  ORF type:complete len:285 (-),score=24.21 TRINITY_DN7719_c0_g2_i1:184-1038(-)
MANESRICAVHGKSRRVRYLNEESADRWICMAGYECKAAGSAAGSDLRVSCTLHGKLRSLDCLQDDGTGKLICTPERRCKTSGEPMPDYRDRAVVGGSGVIAAGAIAGPPGGQGVPAPLGAALPPGCHVVPYGANPYAAYGSFGVGAAVQLGAFGGTSPHGGATHQFPGSPRHGGVPAGLFGAFGGMPQPPGFVPSDMSGMYPQCAGFGMYGAMPGVQWMYGMPYPNGYTSEGDRSRSRRRRSPRKGVSRSTSRRGKRKRRKDASPSHYNSHRRRSPSSSSSSA